ncbi:MAG TPA: replication initiator [Actinomycetota bacterium]|nr:replication initiator [Actinomycetota bacterium]
MTEPILVGELLPGVLQEVIDRAGLGYDRWAEQVAATGYCHHPVRLRGTVEHADAATGDIRTVYSTDREPDATLLKACGNRRASVCPSCSATYQADQFQLLAAGLRGGKGVPETVTGHPRLFVTFTAPSFGRSTPARHRAGWPTRATRTGRASAVRMVGGLAAGSATTPTTRAWGSRCVPAATRPAPKSSGTP